MAEQSNTEWRGQVALVTGASRGIGRAIALRLAREGAAVCVNYATRPEAAASVATEINTSGGRAITIQADVADEAAVRTMADRITAEFGAITILINNAGVSLQATLDSYDAEALARMRRVNVDGVIHTIRAVMDGMRRQRFGRIVNVTSIAAIGTALPGNAFYAASKAEVQILTKRFAMELGPHGITVNAVAPGFVMTEMAIGGRSTADWEAASRTIGARSMVGRVGKPEDIANAVAFFASPASDWVTAQVLTVDGGRMDYIGH
jgi:NAD(P)-dependent dehydrogenase (short-subunit alcohol dehydrogenase family)